MPIPRSENRKQTFLGYELNQNQNTIINHLIPALCACWLYMFVIASDVAVFISHFRNGDPIWTSLTIFFMYLPVLGSYVIIISSLELWPEFGECGRKNLIWFFRKTMEHLLFPFWNMWRFAERIFWSIEALIAKDEGEIQEALDCINAPRSIELYVFLQAYLHALPQILLQLHILMRNNLTINRETEKAQFISIILNLAKVSVTTTYYQRFKSQKLTGKQYPWLKHYKSITQTHQMNNEVVLRKSGDSRLPVHKRRNTSNLEEQYALEPPDLFERRRSSDIYLEPTSSAEMSQRHTLLETDFDEVPRTKIIPIGTMKDVEDGLTEIRRSRAFSPTPRETSVVDGPKRMLLRQTDISERSEPDFNISRVIYVKGLEDDDMAGKLIAFFWWFSFVLARVLAISVFAYFFMSQAIWLLCSHYIIILIVLLYDVKSDQVKRSKAIFFIFIGLVYLFCIIEFKIRFKKATLLYYGYFLLVFTENFVMCMIWFLGEIDSIENDFWFRYVFYVVIGCSITSFSAMIFYLVINQPPKVVIKTEAISKR